MNTQAEQGAVDEKISCISCNVSFTKITITRHITSSKCKANYSTKEIQDFKDQSKKLRNERDRANYNPEKRAEKHRISYDSEKHKEKYDQSKYKATYDPNQRKEKYLKTGSD